MVRRPEPSDLYAGPSMSEAQLRARVVELCHAAGWRVFSLPLIRLRGPAAAKDAIGYPDLTLARHREVRWLELKADKGKLSPEQHAWQDALPWCYVIRPEDLRNGVLVRLIA
jgi:hypothetical protein